MRTYDEWHAKYNGKTQGADLEWFLKRCVLECGKESDFGENGEVREDSAKQMMSEFLERYANEELPESRELQKDFYGFLNGKDEHEEQTWTGHEKLFIERLAGYRHSGNLDQNIAEKLLDFAKKINNDPLRYIYEIIQNADDCEYDENEKASITITILGDKTMQVEYPEKGMSASDIIAITTIGQSNKGKKKKKRIIGEKGIGFKTIFAVCDSIDIHSRAFHFSLNRNNFEPAWIEDSGVGNGTKLILHYADKIGDKDNGLIKANIFEDIIKKYGVKNSNGTIEFDYQAIFQNCPILFTNKIDEIKIKRNDETLVIDRDFRKNENGDNIEIIEYLYSKCEENSKVELEFLRFEKEVEFSYDEYISHYKEVYTDQDDFDNTERQMKTYPIILLVPNNPEKIKKGNIFTYLPTYTHINAPISIQIPFELNLDRSCMWMDGLHGEEHEENDLDGETTKWNARLFKETFISQKNNKSLLEIAFEALRERENIFDYVPNYEKNNHNLFINPDTKYDDNIKKINNYSHKDKENIIFEEFKKMELLRLLKGEGYVSCNDSPIVFSEKLSDILKGIDCPDDFRKLINTMNDPEKTKVIKHINLETYKNASVLGLQRVEIKGEEGKERFFNNLIDCNKEKVFEKNVDSASSNLVQLLNSDITPEFKNIEIEKLKIIHVNDFQVVSYEDGEIWFVSTADESSLENEKFRFLNIGYSLNKEVLEILKEKLEKKNLPSLIEISDNSEEKRIEAIWERIWEKIYSKSGNSEKVECSYRLFIEVMQHFSLLSSQREGENRVDWFEYAKNKINNPDSPMGKNLITLWNNEGFRNGVQEEISHNDWRK